MTNRDPKIEKIETLIDKLGNSIAQFIDEGFYFLYFRCI
jgi:hypothetical protein